MDEADLGPRRDTTSARYRATREQIQEIGWVEAPLFEEQVREAVLDGIAAPLAQHGIVLPSCEVDALLANAKGVAARDA